MAEFPAFGGAQRDAPLFQKEQFSNVQFAINVNSIVNSPKTVVVAVSIVNLKVELVTSTLDRIFAYALASASNELNSSTTELQTENLLPTIHFEIDITKSIAQSIIPATSSGGLPTFATVIVKTANIDILIENLQVSLLASTLERIKAYMTASVANDLNP